MKDKRIGSRAEVWHGTAKQTSGGLTKKDLMRVKTKDGKYRIKSKKQQAMGKKNVKSQTSRKKWTNAVQKARKELIKEDVFDKDEFVPIVKKTSSKLTAKQNRLGKLLYKRAKTLYE